MRIVAEVLERSWLSIHSAEFRAMAALSLAALFWSGNFIAGRALRDDIGPIELNFLRWALAGLLFLPLVGGRLVRYRAILRREWRLVVLLAATGVAGFHSMVYQALTATTAVNALLILTLVPVAILIFEAAKGATRPTPRHWTGTALSLAGAGVLIAGGGAVGAAGFTANPGDLWMLAAVPVWAAYSLLLRRRPADLPHDVALAASIAIALAMLLPIVLIRAPDATFDFSPRLIGALVYIALPASLAAFLLWSHGVSRLGPARAGQFVHLMPVFGPILAVMLLGETITPRHLGGALCVFAGIVLVNFNSERKRS